MFFNPKYTSLFTFNSEYLIDHTKTKGKLRNYDPLKQSFLFLPNDNPKRPIIVPQDYLILNDDSLLQEDIPHNISDPLPPLQHKASQPLGDSEKSSYYAITKKIIHDSPTETKTDIPQPQNFLPTEELQNYKGILDVIKPYHHSKRDIIVTIAEIVNTLEQARNLIQRLVFDTTRVSQSASCIRTS